MMKLLIVLQTRLMSYQLSLMHLHLQIWISTLYFLASPDMAIHHQYKDIENGHSELEKPFIQQAKRVDSDKEIDENGSILMVLLSTCVAVCGSFEFGSCVGCSSPTQSAIRENLKLSVSQFSMFGLIITIGAMIGAITSGRIADFIGRKRVMRMSAVFCIT